MRELSGPVEFDTPPTAPDPTEPTQLATKEYVDAHDGGGGGGGSGTVTSVNEVEPVSGNVTLTPVSIGAAQSTSATATSLVPSAEVNLVAARTVDSINAYLGWLNSQGASGAITEMGIPAAGDNFGFGAITAQDTLRWAEVAETWFRVVDDYDLPVSAFYGAPAQAGYESGSPEFDDSGAPLLRHVHGNYRGFQWGGVVGLSPPEGYSNSDPITDSNWFPPASVAANCAATGITMARVSFRWETLQPTLGGSLDATELARITEAVNALGAAGIKVILDLHNYTSYITSSATRYIGDGTLTAADLVNVWTQLSTAFKGNSAVLAYELMNEPANLESHAGSYATTATGTGTLQAGATIAVAATAVFPSDRAFGASVPVSGGPAYFSAVVTNGTTLTITDVALGGSWAEAAAVTSPQLAWEGISQSVVTAIRGNGDTTPVWVAGYYFENASYWPVNHPQAWITDTASATRYAAHNYWSAGPSGDSYYQPWADELANCIFEGGGGFAPLGGPPPFMGATADRMPLQAGETTLPRVSASTTSVMSSGVMFGTVFRAGKTEVINNVGTWTWTTASSEAPTLARIGVYRVGPDQDFLLVASITSDTTLFTSEYTDYQRTLTAPWYKIAGQLYAVGVLVVQDSGTLPTLVGDDNVVDATLWPFPCFRVYGLSDLPVYIARGTSGIGYDAVYVSMTP